MCVVCCKSLNNLLLFTEGWSGKAEFLDTHSGRTFTRSAHFGVRKGL